MLIRVRSNVGVWRVDINNETTAKVSDITQSIALIRPHVVYEHPFSVDPTGKQLLSTSQSLSSQGVTHGSMIYCRVDPESCVDNMVVSSAMLDKSKAAMETNSFTTHTVNDGRNHSSSNMKRVIDKDGRIKLVPSSSVSNEVDRGFRKGLMPLRDMKMSWTLNDFIALDSQYEFKIQRQESAICQQVSLEVSTTQEFQSYLSKFQFKRKRFGYLYGTFVTKGSAKAENNQNTGEYVIQPTKVRVEAIYEPPQELDLETAEGFVPLSDPNEANAETIASLFGLKRVGWIFGGHEPREAGFVLSGAEILMTAEFQLESAGGVKDTPFVTVKVSPHPNDGTVSVEAFQVSRQCMNMVAEQALELNPDPKVLSVNQTFTAIQEGKESKTVDNNFFLCVVPIIQHTSDLFVSDFPRLNRDVDDRCPSFDEMKKQLQVSGHSGWTFEDRLSDFNLLLFLSNFFDINTDLPKICAALLKKQPIDDGYKLIIKSRAGMEGSY